MALLSNIGLGYCAAKGAAKMRLAASASDKLALASVH